MLPPMVATWGTRNDLRRYKFKSVPGVCMTIDPHPSWHAWCVCIAQDLIVGPTKTCFLQAYARAHIVDYGMHNVL